MSLRNGKKSVTEIISEIYPFDPSNFEKALMRESLSRKGLIKGGIADKTKQLSRSGVMDMLSGFGTQMHSCAQDLMTFGHCPSWKGTYLEGHVRSLIQFFRDYKAKGLMSEVFLEGDDYCGISDGVVEMINPVTWKRERFLIDWKSWGAYKHIYGIIDDKGRSKTSEAKKVSLQLSMYAPLVEKLLGQQLDGLMAIWVHEEGYKTFVLQRDISPFTAWKERNQSPTAGLSLPNFSNF